MGIGVKNVLDAKAKHNMAMPKARKLSFLSLSIGEYPSRICEAALTPREAKSIFLSMLTNLRSKINRGSATKNMDKTKAAKFKPLHKNNVY
jgi:hypothetical protein